MEEIEDEEYEEYETQGIIPNPEIPIEIQKAIKENRFIIFIGAGASRLIGCKSWNELARELIEECYKQKNEVGKPLIDYREKELLLQLNDSKKQITIASELLKSEDFYRIMKNSLKKEEEKENIYDYISNLNGICITTNADTELDKYYQERNIKYKDEDFNANDINKIYLYKIHGTIDKKESLVFTVAQYLKRYSPRKDDNQNFLGFLERIFSEYIILFVGYGISEFELLDYMVLKSKSYKNKRHYTLNGYFSNEEKILQCDEKYYGTLGINIIPFSKDKLGFNQLTEILKKWSEKVSINRKVNTEDIKEMEEILKNQTSSNIEKLKSRFQIPDYKEKFYYKIRLLKDVGIEITEIILENGIIGNKKIDELLKNIEWIELEIIRSIVLRDLEKLDIEKMKNILKELEETQKYILENNIYNYKTNKIILELILILKEKLSKENLLLFSKEMAIEQNWSILFIDLEESILPYLIKNRERKKLEQIFIKILEYNRNHYSKSFGIEKDIIYGKIFSKCSSSIFSLCSLNLTEHLINLIKEAEKKENYIFSEHFIEHINNEKIEYSIGGSLLVKLLYQNLTIKINSLKIEEILKKLLNSRTEIFNRIALKVITENEKVKDLLFERKNLEKLFENTFEELEEYLEKYSNNFTEEQLELIVNIIEKSFNKEKEKLKALYRKSWLNKLKVKNNRINELYEKYNNINPNKDIDFKNQEIEVGWKKVEYISPINKEGLKEYLENNNFEKIISLCKNYENIKDTYFDKKPSKEGLLEVFKEVSSQEINLIINSLNKLQSIDEDYFYYIFDGIQENKKIDLEECKLLLNFLQTKVKENKVWEDKTDYNLKRKISDILYFIFINLIESDEYIEEYLLDIYKIIKEVLEKLPKEKLEERNISLFGLSSYKGNYLRLLIRINLKLKEIKSKEQQEVLRYTQNYLEENVLRDDNISYIVGLHIMDLKYLDEKWVEKNKNKFFNKKKKELFWKTMGAYLLGTTSLYKEIYTFMQEEYKNAIEILEDGEEKYVFQLIEHLLIGYIHYGDNSIFKLIEKSSEKLIEKIIRFIEYYERKINQNKLKKIWNFILKYIDKQKFKENISIQSIGLLSKVNSISKDIIEIIEVVSKNITLNRNLTDMFFLDWLREKMKNKKFKEDELKNLWIVMQKFTEKGILFTGYFEEKTIENFIKLLDENNLKEEGRKLRDDYISKGLLLNI